jgi:hypothetical protein
VTYRLRIAEPRDVPEIEERCAEQNHRDGTSYPVPDIYDVLGNLKPMIALALVIEDEKGNVIQGVVFEKTTEMLLFGCSPHATAELKKQIDGCFYLLRKQGYSVSHTFVPKTVVIPIEKPLAKVGFERDDFKFAHFIKDLTKDEES